MSTSIEPGPLANVLEGAVRPGHFRGVCTVVAKLINITQPTHILLGQKDFQQQAILRAMCADLDVPVEVVTCPTLREADGLAMSSRNRYLNADERSRASGIFHALSAAKAVFDQGRRESSVLESIMRGHLLAAGFEIDYACLRDAATLGEISAATGVLLIAARLGKTRLIDNMLLQ